MRIVRCDQCGAPLSFPDGTTQVTCAYCQQTTIGASVPESVEQPARSGRESYSAGEPVLVSWNGRYWPAHVLAVVAVDAFRIHYDGYSNNWDEIVGPDRIEPRGADVPLARVASPRLALALVLATVCIVGALALALAASRPLRSVGPAPGPVANVGPAPGPVPGPVPGASRAPAPGQALAVGQPVLVLWNDRWWNAEVLGVGTRGTVRVHYSGWSSSWDEDVPPARVRLP